MTAKKPKLRNFAPRDTRYVYAKSFSLVPDLDPAGKPILDKDGNPLSKHDGRTQGQYAHECDINVVVGTYRRADDPFPTQRSNGPGMYADLPDETDLHNSLNKVADATNAFNALPSAIRERYQNNAVNFVAALSNPNEFDFLVENKVLEPRIPAPTPAPTGKNSAAPTGPQTAPDDGAK